MRAAEMGADFTSLDPQSAINLARAAQETLVAEECVAVTWANECEAFLYFLRNSIDEARGHVEDANYQIGAMMNIFNTCGIRVDPFMSLSSPDPSKLRDLRQSFLDQLNSETPETSENRSFDSPYSVEVREGSEESEEESS